MRDGPPLISDFVIQVTFSSRISNCLSTAPSSLCECSSTTSIFHLPGGLTDLSASKNSEMKLVVRRITTKQKGTVLLRTIVIKEVILVILREKFQIQNGVKESGYFRLYYTCIIGTNRYNLLLSRQCTYYCNPSQNQGA